MLVERVFEVRSPNWTMTQGLRGLRDELAARATAR
jgi:hypothetical protein